MHGTFSTFIQQPSRKINPRISGLKNSTARRVEQTGPNLEDYLGAVELAATKKDYVKKFLSVAKKVIADSQKETGFAKFPQRFVLIECKLAPADYAEMNYAAFKLLHEMGSKAAGYAAYYDTLRIVFEAVMAYNAGKNIIIDMPTQSGKTLVMVMLSHLLRLDQKQMKRGLDEIVITCHGRVGAYEATKNDFENFTVLHGTLRFAGGRENVRDLGLGLHNVIKRNTGRNAGNEIIPSITRAKQRRVGLAMIIDEADEGTQAKTETNDGGVLQRYVDFAAKAGVKMRMILVSATPYQYAALDEFHTIKFRPSAKVYTGLIFGKQVNVNSFKQIADLIAKEDGLVDVTNLGKDDFNTNDDKYSPHLVVSRLMRAFARGIVNATMGFNGRPFNGGKHVVMRISDDTKRTEEILNKLEKGVEFEKLGITIVRFYGSGMTVKIMDKFTGKLVKLSIERVLERHDNCLFVVVGGARRADRFPETANIHVDFTPNFSNMSSLEQGLPGRITGYGKTTDTITPVLIVSKANYEAIQLQRKFFKLTGERYPVKPVTRAVNITGRRISKQSIGVSIDIMQIPELTWVFERLMKATKQFLRINTERRTTSAGPNTIVTVVRHTERRLDIFGGLFTDEEIVEIEKILSDHFNTTIKLLRPGQVRDGKYRYEPNDRGLVKVAARNMNSNDHGRDDSRESRNTNKRVTEGKSEDELFEHVQMSIHWRSLPDKTRSTDTKDWTIGSVYFPLLSETTLHTLADVLPSKNSIYFPFMTPAQQAQSLANS